MNSFSLRTPLSALSFSCNGKVKLMPGLIVWLVMIFALCHPYSQAHASAGKKQLICLPFTVQIPGSYAYLQDGLASTLASRLASRAKITAAAHTKTSDDLARAMSMGEYSRFGQILEHSGADYLVMGSLSPRAGQFELLSYVFSRTGAQAPTKFEQLFQSVDDAMNAVDEMAWQISGKIFNTPRPDMAAASATSGMGGFQTEHPEKAYRQGLSTGATAGLEQGGPFNLTKSFRSKGIAGEAMDINAADLDGNGQDEILVLTNGALRLFHDDNGSFRMLATIDLPDYLRYHAITMADMNHNGLQEIYISASNGDFPDTTIMEWDGRKVNTLANHIPWYMATLTAPGAPPMLVGQKAISYDIAGNSLYSLQLTDTGKVLSDKQLSLPQQTNIFDFTLADITGDGTKEFLTINSANRLQVFDASGTLRWTSPEVVGASNKFYGSLTSQNNSVAADNNNIWLHTRIAIADLNQDGVNDVLVGRNRVETVRFMPNFRYFEGASLAAFQWQNGTMQPLWETRTLPGYMTNYQVGNSVPDQHGYQVFFVISENSNSLSFWQSSTSYLHGYSLQINQDASKP